MPEKWYNKLKYIGSDGLATTREKIDKNIVYAWKQIENWIKHYYGKNIQVEVIEDKYLFREKKYAKTVFEQGKPPTVHIDYKLLLSGNKQNILYAACREAVRIGLLANGIKATEISPEFRGELKKYGLPDYGGFPETGADLYTYDCLKCGAVYALTPRKIPESKSPAYKPNITTNCCGAMIHDSGKVFYKNEELQKMGHLLGIKPTSQPVE